MPDDTLESVRNTVDLAFFLAIAPWPYSDIYPQLKDHIATADYSRYNLVEAVVKPKGMTLEEVNKALGHASRDFYMHKMQTLASMSSRKREFMIKVVTSSSPVLTLRKP